MEIITRIHTLFRKHKLPIENSDQAMHASREYFPCVRALSFMVLQQIPANATESDKSCYKDWFQKWFILQKYIHNIHVYIRITKRSRKQPCQENSHVKLVCHFRWIRASVRALCFTLLSS
jgi:hypothetical protein